MSSFDPRSPGTYSSFSNDKTQSNSYTYDSDSGQRRACLSSQPRIDLNVTQTPLLLLQTHPPLLASSDVLPSVPILPAMTTASKVAVMTTVSQNMQKSRQLLQNSILTQRSVPLRMLSPNGRLPGRLTRPSPHLLRTADPTLALPLRTYQI